MIIMALMAATAAGASAQAGDDNRKVRIGVEGGLNISSVLNADGTKCGFNVGVNAEINLNGGWFLEGALKLSSKPFVVEDNYYFGEEWNSSTQHGELNIKSESTPYYLHIPVHFGYKTALTDNINLSVSAGPYLGIGLWGKGTDTITTEGTLPSEAPKPGKYKINNVYKDSDMRRIDFGMGVKVGLELNCHYRVSVGYDIQINSLTNNDDYYNQVVSIGVGYTF